MSIRVATHPALPLLAAALAVAFMAAGCKRAERAERVEREAPRPAPAVVKETPLRTKEQAMEALLAVPELKARSEQIERRSQGKAHGAVIEDDPVPREVNGRKYYQLSFVENRADSVHRRESFLVAQQGDEILVEDTANDTLLTLQEWRRNIRRVELKSAD